MINLSVTSPLFILCLLIGPLLMCQKLSTRRLSFLITSGVLFFLTLHNFESFAIVSLFIFLPYMYVLLIQRCNVPLWPALVIQIALFIYASQYEWILSLLSIPMPSFLPVLGLSYMLFRQIDILFQVKSNLVKEVPIIDYLNYLLSFWTLFAGPIQRYKGFIKNFYEPETKCDDEKNLKSFHRVVNGFLKVLIIAPLVLLLTDSWTLTDFYHATGNPLFLVPILYGFPIYLYFNFSGYCDIVIGMARWAGFTIQENFNKPWLARDIGDMWRRWHITLSEWLRDYVYQPLFKFLLTRKCSFNLHICQYFSIFFTFLLAGIWHGTTTNWIIFGFLQGLGMAISMIYRDVTKKHFGKAGYKRYYDNPIVAFFERVITLHFWCLTCLFITFDIARIAPYVSALIG